MRRISICGHFGFGKNLLNGQTVKTKIISDELEKYYGKGKIERIDTHGGRKSVIKMLLKLFVALLTGNSIVILPAYNGIRVIVPFLYYVNKVFHRKLFYVVIGGWLPAFLESKPVLKRQLQSFTGIYVETNSMKNALIAQLFENIYVLPNCKKLSIIAKKNLKIGCKHKKMCTFSRVMKEKGIQEAIEAVKRANEEYGEEVFSLDIYGQIDSKQEEWFRGIMESAPSYIKYAGVIPYDKSSEVLKEYFVLLFPTYHEGEGFAGTLIDAMAAGVPVIATDWKYNAEIVIENKIGYLVKPKDVLDLKNAILKMTREQKEYYDYKINCIVNAEKYLPENAIRVLIEGIGE